MNVPPELRTWLTDRMMEVKNTLGLLTYFQEEGVTPEMKGQLAAIVDRLEVIVHDLQSPYFDNGSLSLLGLERSQNKLFRAGHSSMMRVNINMTDANKRSQALGTAFKYVVLEWLQREFGIRSVSVNPEGTSFLVINVTPDEISCALRRFTQEIKLKLETEEIQKRYGFDSTLLDRFTPSSAAMVMDLTTEGFAITETLMTGDRRMIMDLQNKIITLIEDAQRLLAVGTTLIEKEGPEAFGMKAMFGGMSVFNAADLPMTPQMTGYDRLQMGLRIGLGYVPAAEYVSPLDDRMMIFPAADGKLTFHPRFAHNYGLLYALAMARLKDAVKKIQDAATPEQTEAALITLKDAVESFTIIFTIGEIARTNPRNRLFTKWIQNVELHDGTKKAEYYFLEEVSMMTGPNMHNVHMTVWEIDSFKAYSSVYPVDETDSNFWGIFDQFVWVAKERGIDPPVMTQMAGDLVAVAISTVDQQGRSVDLADFISRVQKRIAGVYGNKKFQDTRKVEVPNGHGNRVERQPLWLVGDEFVASWTQPPGSRPYLRTLSVSAVGATIPIPRTSLDIAPFFAIMDNLARRVDTLKDETSPQKGQYRIVSTEQTELQAEQAPISSVTGYYIPREVSSHSAELVSFIARIDDELTEIWGEPWSSLSADVKRAFSVRLIAMMRGRQIRPVLDNNVAQQVFRQIGHAMPRIPQTQILLAPVLPRVGVTL